MKRIAFGLLAVAIVLTVAPASSASATTLRDRVAAVAVEAGIDPSWFLAQDLTIETLEADGDRVVATVRIDEVLDRLETLRAPGTRTTTPTPTQVNAGDLLHLYAHICFPCSSALRYSLTASAVVPSTPPVVLPPPATPLFFDAGGPLRQVKGGGWNLLGVHTVGTAVGSNIDSNNGPAPFPVWVPVATGGVVPDRDIDFIGHAAVGQGQFCFFSICFGLGALLGDGVTLFDNSSGHALPIVP